MSPVFCIALFSHILYNYHRRIHEEVFTMKQIRQILPCTQVPLCLRFLTTPLPWDFWKRPSPVRSLCRYCFMVLHYFPVCCGTMIRTAIIRAAHPTDPSLADFDSSPIQSKTVHPTGSSRGCTVCLFARTFVSHNRLIYFISCQTKEKDRISVRPALFVLMAFFFFLFLFSFV